MTVARAWGTTNWSYLTAEKLRLTLLQLVQTHTNHGLIALFTYVLLYLTNTF